MPTPPLTPRQSVHDPARRSAHEEVGLPPSSFPGLDRGWSRVVLAADADGLTRRWHLLDNGPQLEAAGVPVRGTVLAVHGNPTWSYLWRRVLEQAPPGWRVVAVDQLGMGWSERPGRPRTLAQRVDDLAGLTDALGLRGPVVALAHDWGGPVALGWALAHPDLVAGVVLTNTAVHQPVEHAAPSVIRLARAPVLLAQVCRTTPAFVRATTALSRPSLPRGVRDAFAAPYAGAHRRDAVADFVRDIPFEDDHPSRAALDRIADGVRRLDVPALLVWGPRDPVFSQRYLEDLLGRLPHADVHLCPSASHLVLEDSPEAVGVVWDWVQQHAPGGSTAPEGQDDPAPAVGSPPRVATVPVAVDVSRPEETAVVELGGAQPRRVSFAELDGRVEALARGLAARGVRPGDRVAVLVPPGIDLTTVVYAVWRLGAVVVIADAGLGLGRLGAALRGAGPRHVIGITPALALAATTRVPGRRIRVDRSGSTLADLAAEGLRHDAPLPEGLDEDADGAVLFTSGATGPPKGVVYTRRGLGAQVALLRDTFGFGPGERFVAAFAPFALYGPALGLTSAVPDMDVTAPHTLTADALAQAVEAVEATMVFAAPAALRNVVATAGSLTAHQREVLAGPRLVLSAGAPVPTSLLHEVRAVLPGAQTQTPYGMTEALPVATHDPTASGEGPGAEQPGAGVCVGHPVPGVEVGIAALDPLGVPADDLQAGPGVVGEIVVRGPHVKDRYDRRWGAQRRSARPVGWHRTGDVGRLDDQGRLWVEGRLAHVVPTADGPVTPYPVEDRVRGLDGIADVAVVGVGPVGTQLVVLVLVPTRRAGALARATGAPRGARALAGPELAARARAAAAVPVAAVLVRDWLPVDVRHASKVDRTALAHWAEAVLHGARPRRRGGAPRTRSR
ncbi:alpha/beta fold hydrolase [uncultured Serinicoccus sp.]|uniref:alpha/beta fold hydrolase n=1 Tax=uncultured Serinicoccus sp. TaxID=735514 RepID=UPI00260A2547|nr:alpha/beta fold hydrolase [uncultured Serinicoccus sp.]